MSATDKMERRILQLKDHVAELTAERDVLRDERDALRVRLYGLSTRLENERDGAIERELLARERLIDIREQLRIAEAVRDDARAASQRRLDELRAMTAARDEAVAIAERLSNYVQKFLAEGGPTRAAWHLGVTDAHMKLAAAKASGIELTDEKIAELIGILHKHPPQRGTAKDTP